MASQAAAGTITAAHEWRRHWPLVLAGMAGLSLGTLPTATLGLFMQPLSDEFGWSRTQVSLGLMVFAAVSMPLTPFAGILVDRFGSRRVAVPGMLITATCFASFGLMTGAFYQWVLIWMAYAVSARLITSLVWSSAISRGFTASRGFALAVLLCGTAIATALGPTVARLLIEHWGWRGGYIGLGLGWGGLGLVLAVLFFHDVKAPVAPATSAVHPAAALRPGGLTLREGLRNLVMIRITFAIFVQAVMGTAIMVHIVPMLTQDGLTPAQATTVAAIIGVASITGKLVCGWLIDRISGSLLPMIAYGGPGIAYALLLQATGSVWLQSVAVFVLGFCSGAALQLAVYLTTRYAGLRAFGAIFGVVSSMMAAAAGIGPVLAATIFDATGEYTLLLTIGISVAVVAGLAVFRLGPYPEFAPVAPEPRLSENPAPAA